MYLVQKTKMQDEAWKKVSDSLNAVGRALRTVEEVKGKAQQLLKIKLKNKKYTVHICALIVFVHTSLYFLNIYEKKYF